MAIEGIDGCGKTTQARMLVDRLKMNGYETTCVRPVYVLLNLMRLRVRDKNSVSPRKTRVYETPNKNPAIIQRAFMGLLGYLYALATYIFLKVYCRNKIVVCDRYFYQFFFDLFGNWNGNVIKFFPKPDTTFFLDGDLDLFYSRMDNSFDASVSRDYYSEVLNLYKKISQKYGFIQIDAKLNKEAINGVILTHLTKRIGEVL